MFLVIFTALLGHGAVRVSPTEVVNTATYYVAAMASFDDRGLLYRHRDQRVLPARYRHPEARQRHAAAELGLPRRADAPRTVRRRPARRNHRLLRPAPVQRRHPHRRHAAPVPGHAGGPACRRTCPGKGGPSLRGVQGSRSRVPPGRPAQRRRRWSRRSGRARRRAAGGVRLPDRLVSVLGTRARTRRLRVRTVRRELHRGGTWPTTRCASAIATRSAARASR